jgi:hypothetical protein
LYGAFVLNPNAKISPCCASPAEKDDFGEYLPSRGFFDVWNNNTFKRARSLFSQSHALRENTAPTDAQVQNTIKRLDGLGGEVQALLKEDQLICHKCPIVFTQDVVDMVIDYIANLHASYFKQTGDIRHFIALLLMGLPYRWLIPKTNHQNHLNAVNVVTQSILIVFPLVFVSLAKLGGQAFRRLARLVL